MHIGTIAPYKPVETTPLDVLKVLADKYRTTVASAATPVESKSDPADDLQEIVVTGRPVPWYVWALAGGIAFAALSKLGGR